jgi:hypothetical protein
LSDIFGLAENIKENNAGFVVKANAEAPCLKFANEEYRIMSHNAFRISKNHSKDEYIKRIIKVVGCNI